MPEPLAPETIARRLLGAYFLESWLGPAQDQKTYCPVAIQGVEFDYTKAEDVAPFTPEEVLGAGATPGVGYVYLRIFEIDNNPAGVTSGLEAVGSDTRFVQEYHRLLNLEFSIYVPSRSDPAIAERYACAIEELFQGLTIRPSGEAGVTLKSIRQHSRWPIRRRSTIIDDGSLRTSFLDVRVEARERRPHAGSKEVSLP